MAKKTAAMAGTLTLDLDRRPEVPMDSDRLELAIQQIPEITSHESFERVAEIVKTCAQRIKVVTDFFSAMKSSAHKAHKTICESEKTLTTPFAKIREVGEKRMAAFTESQETAKAEQEQEIQQSGQELKDELYARAKELRRLGDIRQAKELERQADQVVVDITLPDNQPEVDGIQGRRKWEGICERPMELIAAVSEGRTPLMFTLKGRNGEVKEEPILIVNQSVLNHFAMSLGQDMAQKLPGCKAKQKIGFAVTAGKED